MLRHLWNPSELFWYRSFSVAGGVVVVLLLICGWMVVLIVNLTTLPIILLLEFEDDMIIAHHPIHYKQCNDEVDGSWVSKERVGEQ